jgi:4a-hydroxytetrahydrobiopterin dehydratase
MALLSEDEIEAGLERLPQWTRDGGSITRAVSASSFLEGVALVVAVARAAEEADHHPDIDIRWTTVRFTLSTHSEGGLTAKDLSLAHEIDRIAAG